MGTEEWLRAGKVIADRMEELGLNTPQLARKARVHPSTVRAVISGERWPRTTTTLRIVDALDWTPDEVTRRVWGGRVALEDVPLDDLARELCRRLVQDHHVR